MQETNIETVWKRCGGDENLAYLMSAGGEGMNLLDSWSYLQKTHSTRKETVVR